MGKRTGIDEGKWLESLSSVRIQRYALIHALGALAVYIHDPRVDEHSRDWVGYTGKLIVKKLIADGLPWPKEMRQACIDAFWPKEKPKREREARARLHLIRGGKAGPKGSPDPGKP